MKELMMGKERFLTEHNRLSPVNLQATLALLTRFQEEKQPFLKDAEWSFKLRPHLISWLLMLPLLHPEKSRYVRKSTEHIFRNYPETHNP
jgi:hypothetical protein